MKGLRKNIGAALALVVSAFGVDVALADVFATRDEQGVYHFTNRATSGSSVFVDAALLRRQRALGKIRQAPLDGPYAELIQKIADSEGVDAHLVRAVIRAESDFDRVAVSRRGARGLMQLMPATARELGVRNVYSPEQNVRGGVQYLREMLDRYRSVPLALAAYNAGPGAVDRHRSIPPILETRRYVSRVLRYRRELQIAERRRAR